MSRSHDAARLVSLAIIAPSLAVVGALVGPAPAASAAVSTPTKVISVSHSAAVGAFLTQGGDVYTYGDNSVGATGQGLTSGVTETPVKLAAFAPAGEKVVQVAVGGPGSLASANGFGLALTDAGHVFAWGYDGQGNLGNDAALANQSSPVAVSPTWGSDKPVYIANVASGGRVVTESGHVYAWGYNEWGQTGVDNGGGNIATPVEVTSLYRPADKVAEIVGGGSSMIVRTASGAIFAAGSKARGQRGDGTSDPNNVNTYTPALSQLSFTGLPAGDSVTSIGSGTSYSFAVSGTGKVWGWGFGQSGRLGDGGGTHDQLTPLPITPTLVDAGDKVASVEMGGSANISMLLTQQGQLYTVGSGNNGMLGNGATANTTAFGKITSWPGRGSNDPIVDGVAGASNALAVTQSGAVYTWGNSLVTNQGGIGTGTQNQTGTPPNVVSSPVPLAQPAALSPFTDPVDASISGTVSVGSSLTGSAGTYAPADATIAYAWTIGSDPVSSTSSYTPKLADAGSTLTLTVTGTKSGYTDSVSATAGQTVATVQGFTGTVKAGQTLSASDPTGTSTWGLSTSSSCTSPANSTGNTFALPSDSAGKYVRLSQTIGARTGSGTCVGPIAAATAPATITGAATAAGVKGQPFSYTPSLGGTPPPTVSSTSTLPGGVTLTAVTGELTGTPTTAGTFPVTLTATNGVGQPATVGVTITIDDVVTGLAPVISGTPTVGEELTASPGASVSPGADDGATVSYQWQYESAPGVWMDIATATSPTYTPAPSEVGRVYRAKVAVAKAGFVTSNAVSDPTIAVVKGTFSISAPVVTGTAAVGQTLTCAAAPGTLGTVSYAWTRGGTSLGTGATYELTSADRTHAVTCTVTSVRAGYTDATNSVDSATVGSGTFTIPAPVVSGTAAVGQTLTCASGVGTLGAVSYAWTRGGSSLGTGATYELTPADRTHEVTCTATSVRAGYTDATNSVDSATVGYGSFTIPAPAITGTAAVGQTLTCAPGNGTVGTVTFEWTRGATSLGTGTTYVPAPADRTHEVTCTVTSVRAGYTDAANSADSATVDYGSFTIPAPVVTGTAAVGETLTCTAGLGTTGAVSYAWRRGATPLGIGATYALTAADRTHEVTCTVTSVRAGYTDATNSVDSATVDPGTFTIPAPLVTGTAAVGETLTCVPDQGTVGTVSYTWTRGATPVATGATYELTPDDRTHVVTCTVTSQRPGYTDATSGADSGLVGLGTFTVPAPVITGTAEVGQTLTCAAGSQALGQPAFAWTRGQTALAAGATYELTPDDRTQVVTCTVTSVRDGYTDATNSTASDTIDFGTFAVPAPVITGTAEVGQALTCAPAPGTRGTVSFAWTRGQTALGPDATYELTPADRTHIVTCTVTSARDGYIDASNSAESDTVELGTFAVPAPTVTGIAAVGETMTCSAAPGTLGTVSYAWTRGQAALGAGATYELTPADRTHVVTCTVTSARDGYVDAANSVDSEAVGSGTFTIPTPVVTGSAVVDGSLTCAADNGTVGAVTFAWSRGQTALGSGTTYAPDVDDFGSVVTCTATSERPGYTDATSSTDSAEVTEGTFTIGAPQLTGNPEVGQSLTCAAAAQTPGATTFVWRRGQIDLGAGATYELTPADRTHAVTCVVTSTRTGYHDAVNQADSAMVDFGTFTIDPPVITGSMKVGQTLTCGAAAGTPGTASYAWTRGQTSVGTEATYELVPADLDEILTCTATVQREGYLDAVESADTAQVGKGSFTVGAPVVTGEPAVGQTLTCAVPAGTPGQPSYQWTTETGALLGSGSTYTLTTAELGHTVSCAATVDRAGYATAAATAATPVVALGAAGAWALSTRGKPLVAARVRGTVAGLPAGASVSWHWLVDGKKPKGKKTTRKSFRPSAQTYGRDLSVQATVHVPGYKDAFVVKKIGRIRMQHLDLTLDSSTLHTGQPMEFTVTNIAPGEAFVLRLGGHRIATGIAFARGRVFAGSLRIPARLFPRPGSYGLTVKTVSPLRTARVRVEVL